MLTSPVKIITESNKSFEKSHGITLRASNFTNALAIYNKSGTQSEIDRSVFAGIDVFIGFMHARFGRPVAGSKSGAEHEYVRAIEAHNRNGIPKYILFGFSDEPVRPSEIDGVQMEAVKQFRAEIEGKQLCFKWKTPDEFRTIFREQLEELVMRYKNDLNNYVPGGLRYS